MSGGITFGATITGGIQNVAGLLPLLGTQQCEEHIGSALTMGYLYAAATPMSIFGSLGVARAGFKTLIACMSGRTWSGAKILANMGFEPKGINLSLVMIDKNDKDGRHLAETRFDELVKELHIDKTRVTVSHKCTRWNVTMILLTAFISSLGVLPYIHLNYGGSNLSHFSQWTFPILRAIGGFLTASMIPLVLQRRISRLTASCLVDLNRSETPDVPWPGNPRGPGVAASKKSSTERPPTVDGTRGAVGMESLRSTAHYVSHDSGIGDIEKALNITETPSNNVLAYSAGDVRPITTKINMAESRSSNEPCGALDWLFLGLLLAGILSSVVGYVGCFSVVQNAKSSTGPLSWLCLESGLSVVRMILWGLNPKGDDAPPLELVLKLDHDTTFLPTCNLDDTHILRSKVLPLTRANQFLNMITSFAGLVERFTHPDLTLYYTLTRKQSVTDLECSDEIGSLEHPDDVSSLGHSKEAGKRVLYITLFDHKERTTRVYTRDSSTERFYSTASDVPLIDLEHGLLETKLDSEIIGEDDLIAGDPKIHSLLRIHHQSIMDQIHFVLGEIGNPFSPTRPSLSPAYAIENRWTFRTADTMGARERTRLKEQKQGFGGMWGLTVERGRHREVDRSHPVFERDRLYLEQGRIEAKRQSLDMARGQWIESYMELVISETRDRLEAETTTNRRVDGLLDGKRVSRTKEKLEVVSNSKVADMTLALQVVEEGLIDERRLMERLLMYEVEAWEGLVWKRVQAFMNRDDVSASGKARLKREWQGNCWKRLDANIRAMDTRMERAKAEISALPSNKLQSTLNSNLNYVHDEIRSAWRYVVERLIYGPDPSASPTPGSRFSQDLQKLAQRIDRFSAQPEQERRWHQEMAGRLKKELDDVEFRIAQGLDLCDQFFDDEQLLECRHSRSKSLFLHCGAVGAPLEFYSRALKGNNDVHQITFDCDYDEDYAWFAKTICDLPSSVTTVWFQTRQPEIPLAQRDSPLFIYCADSQSFETFLDIGNDQSLTHTRDTYVFMDGVFGDTIVVSFFGPPSGNLIVRLKHRAHEPDTTLTVLDTSFTLTIPESLIIDDINLRPIGDSPSKLSFLPNTRNNLVLQASKPRYIDNLHDLQLLDEDGNPYGRPQHNIPAAELDDLNMSDDRESS